MNQSIPTGADPVELDGRLPDVVEKRITWPGGSLENKTRTTRDRSEGCIRSNRFAIGFGFLRSGGEMEWLIDGKSTLQHRCSSRHPGHEMVILPPGCEFRGVAEGYGECLWLNFDRLPNAADGEAPWLGSAPIVDRSWSNDRLCRTLMSEIRAECRNDFPRGPVFAESAATTLFVQLNALLAKMSTQAVSGRSLNRRKMKVVERYVAQNLHRSISLPELSALLDLTPSYFCRVFKSAMGRSPHQFVIEQRVQRAKELLHTTLPLAEVALMVGFANQSHLNSSFLRLVGVPPARYRRERDNTVQ